MFEFGLSSSPIFDRKSLIGNLLFSCSRRKMFSTSTIASSTNSPIATAMPPSVITLIESSLPVIQPINRKTIVVSTNESGIAVKVINVVRKFSKNRNRTMTTNTAPIAIASATLKIPRSMKFLSWNSSALTTTSAGSDDSTSVKASTTRSVRSRVSTCGCLTTVKTIPIRPLTLPSPRLNCDPSVTRATWSSNTGRRGWLRTGIFLRSSRTTRASGPSRPRMRIGRSVSPVTAKPPLVLMLLSRSARSTSCRVTLYSRSAVGLIRI
ncbi:hypothetical protein Poly41_40030 [Novipirellula artificiosorum]|uniref:Uncharacterized protein n=1 Tax=Novipirellula artificiosorum TaxID=2528016 RepID=A0A5C6DDI6_9BACT|nr:hypothetical protein Poly41_40030 [Novipirellula artificiosorum]